MARKLTGSDDKQRQQSETTAGHGGSELPNANRTVSRLGRRALLQTSVAAATGLLVTGSAVASADSTDRESITFERTIDAVDDLGMDPEGNTSVTESITSIEPNTLVQFPDGEYLIDERIDLPLDGTVGFEAVGDATIVGAEGFGDTAWNVRGVEGVYYGGFTHDQSDGAVGHFFRASEQIEIHDIDVTGRAGDWAVELAPHITDPDGVARVVNYTNKTGSSWASYAEAAGRIGAWVGHEHEGTLQFIDCDFREYGNNALYTSHCPGNVQVIDSYFENNNVASIRIGGDGSFVENTEIVISEDRYTGPREDEDTSFFLRGILIEEHHERNGQKPAGAAVKDCEILVEDNPTNGPAIEVWSNGRSLDVTGTTIEYHTDGTAAIRREDYSPKRNHPPGEPPRALTVSNCTVTGSGSVPAVIDIEDGDESLIEACEITWDGTNVDGIRIANSDDCAILDSTVDVPGEATVFVDSTVETSGNADELGAEQVESDNESTTDTNNRSESTLSLQLPNPPRWWH